MDDGVRLAIIVIFVQMIIVALVISIAVRLPLITVIIICILLGMPIILGTAMLFRKGGSFLAGWNTMTVEQKVDYDEGKLLRFFGTVIIVFMMMILSAALLISFQQTLVGSLLIISALVFLVACIVYANTDRRFKSEKGRSSLAMEEGRDTE